MTIRDGGRPRDERSQAHPAAPGVYDAAPRPDRDDRQFGNGSNRRRDRGGIGGFVRFLAFALILAAIVLTSMLTVLRPIVSGALFDWAYDNPGALRMPFVADIVRDRLGDTLTEPASNDPTEVEFAVLAGDTPAAVARRLADAGLVRDERAFIFQATLRELAPKLQEGNFRLARNMTPDQLVTGLIENRIVITVVPVNFREGLRIEQITAKLQTLGPPLTIDPKAFYDLATDPPAALLDDYPWLAAAGLPKGASLEGFLGPATYDLTAESTAEDLVRQMLDAFHEQVGDEPLAVPKSRGLTFYQILTLASIVDHEAVLDEERPLIAGVYQNRLNSTGAGQILAADPVVFYALDTVALGERDFATWQEYAFWVPPGVALGDVTLPKPLEGYQSYRVRGLPPGPICTPSLASIDAALAPDTKDHYLYFLAIPDSGGKHVFARTQKEHDANKQKYGYL